MSSQRDRSALGALVLLWAPTVVGILAIIILRNLYGVAFLFGSYAVIFVILRRSGRAIYLGYALVCLAVTALLVIIQSQL